MKAQPPSVEYMSESKKVNRGVWRDCERRYRYATKNHRAVLHKGDPVKIIMDDKGRITDMCSAKYPVKDEKWEKAHDAKIEAPGNVIERKSGTIQYLNRENGQLVTISFDHKDLPYFKRRQSTLQGKRVEFRVSSDGKATSIRYI